jgi:hypothetical protein
MCVTYIKENVNNVGIVFFPYEFFRKKEQVPRHERAREHQSILDSEKNVS